jgi:hypothetical protein
VAKKLLKEQDKDPSSIKKNPIAEKFGFPSGDWVLIWGGLQDSLIER